MPLTPEQLRDATKPIEDVYSAIELLIFISIAERLRDTHEELQDNPLVWQTRRLLEAESLQRDAIDIVRQQSPAALSLFLQVLREASFDHLELREGQLQEAFELGLLPAVPQGVLRENPQLLAILSTYNATARDRLNLINTTVLQGSQQVYRNIISQSVAQVLTGTQSAQGAMRSALSTWNDKGMPTLQRRDGARLSAEGYVGMITRTVTNNVTNEMQFERNRQYGNDLVEVSSHSGARPLCAPYQGRVYSMSGTNSRYKAWSSTSYGEPGGLLGINCGHQVYPFFESVSKRSFEPQQTVAENAKTYKESQRQRALEREIRKAKHREDILKAAGDEEGAERARKLIRQRQERMRGFIDESGRTRRYDRERIQRRN